MVDITISVETLGALLKRRRGDLTLRELAEATGMPHSMLSNYENNHHEPRLRTLHVLARVLEFSDDDWLHVRVLIGRKLEEEAK